METKARAKLIAKKKNDPRRKPTVQPAGTSTADMKPSVIIGRDAKTRKWEAIEIDSGSAGTHKLRVKQIAADGGKCGKKSYDIVAALTRKGCTKWRKISVADVQDKAPVSPAKDIES